MSRLKRGRAARIVGDLGPPAYRNVTDRRSVPCPGTRRATAEPPASDDNKRDDERPAEREAPEILAIGTPAAAGGGTRGVETC